MPNIKPFKGFIYNEKKVKNLSRVVAPPYDIIPKRLQEDLYKRHPYNVVRLILGKIKNTDSVSDNRYTRAKSFLDRLIKEKALIHDAKDAIYVYSQTYREGDQIKERIGFIGLFELDRSKKSKVLAHENTLLAPKLDRLELMRQVRSNLSPIFVLYEDDSHKVLDIMKKSMAMEKPFVDIAYDGIRNRLWRMSDKESINRIHNLLKKRDLFIADGHHRYEVASTYCVEAQGKDLPLALKKNSHFIMAYFVEASDSMLTVLATHRFIKNTGLLRKSDIKARMGKFFHIEECRGLKDLLVRLNKAKDRTGYGIYTGDGVFYLAQLKDYSYLDKIIRNKIKDWKRLDVTILHLFVLEYALGIRDDEDNIEFVKDAEDAIRLVDKSKSGIAFFLNPTKVSQVKNIARLGERMPRKATYFYPKPLSGLVIRKMD